MADAPPGLPAVSILKWTGLFQSVDPFAIASGAMEIADNVVIPGPSLLQPRRGFDAVNAGVDWAAIGTFSGFIMAMSAHDTPLGATDGLFWVDVGVGNYAEVTRAASTFFLQPALLSAYGNGAAIQTKSHFFTANGNFYETTNFGLARVEKPKGTWVPAGMDTPVVEDGSALATGTWFLTGHQVAYRYTYRYTDTNGVEHRGPPSRKQVHFNTSGASKGITLSFEPTTMCLPGTIIEVWRTLSVPIPADGSDGTGDECFKITEFTIPTSGTVTVGPNGYLRANLGQTFGTYVDQTPDVPFLVEPLYTNPTTGALNGLGIGNQNTPPPACADAFTFKGRTYYCNTEEVQRLTVQIIGTGTGGIVDGDTFYVDGVGYQWKDTGPASSGFFYVQIWRTGGAQDAGSVVENLRRSADTAAFTINIGNGLFNTSIATSPVLPLEQQLRAAQQLVNDLPGYITIERLIPGAAGFSVVAGVGAGRGWAGSLATNNVSDSNRQPANLMQSQPNDPESVPAAFTNSVGQAELAILRGIPLRDYAYLFKAGDDGLWKFSDDGDGNLTIGPLDATVHLVAPETAVSLDNALYCLTDKGVIRVTDGGAPEHISEARIAEELDAIMRRVGPATLARLAFGVAYESDHTYVLCLPEAPNSVACTIQYIYNNQTDAWTRWTLPVLSCGLVAPFAGDVLVFGLRPHGVAGLNIERTLWVERKALTALDYQDPPVRSLHVPGAGTYASNTLVFTGKVNVAPGDLIQYILSTDLTHIHLNRVLTADYDISANQTTVVCEQSLTWKAGDALFILKGIQAHVKLLPLTDGDPLFEKQWQNVYLFFRYSDVDRISVSYSSEKQQIPKSYTLPGPTEKAWLYDETLGFGLAPWGAAANNIILKLALDQAASRSAALTVDLLATDALGRWELSALRIPYDPSTMRSVK